LYAPFPTVRKQPLDESKEYFLSSPRELSLVEGRPAYTSFSSLIRRESRESQRAESSCVSGPQRGSAGQMPQLQVFRFAARRLQLTRRKCQKKKQEYGDCGYGTLHGILFLAGFGGEMAFYRKIIA